MEGKKNKVYRIVENNWYEHGAISTRHTNYHVEVQKKFLWKKYWSSIKESHYDYKRTIEFKTIEEAQILIERLKNAEIIEGWSRRVVYGDPEFEKI
jgi:hypothetical protein